MKVYNKKWSENIAFANDSFWSVGTQEANHLHLMKGSPFQLNIKFSDNRGAFVLFDVILVRWACSSRNVFILLKINFIM